MKKKKILIAGAFYEFGGRELMTSFISKSLDTDYDVDIFSINSFTNNSKVLHKDFKGEVFFLNQLIYKKNILIRFFTFLLKIRSFFRKQDVKTSDLINNKLNKYFFDFDQLTSSVVSRLIKNYDLVIINSEIYLKVSKKIIDSCKKSNVKIIFRTTGTIQDVDNTILDYLKNVDFFIHHSESNANSLSLKLQHRYVVIDQCAFNENRLLDIPILNQKPLVFGFLGRLHVEKGIVELIDLIKKTNEKLIIAGEGELEELVLKLIERYPQFKYIGSIENSENDHFFKQIDVLIISSFHEAGPLVAIEAMAAGKIIISTDVGAMKSRLEELESFWFKIDELTSLIKNINCLNKLSTLELNNISMSYRDKYLQNHRVDSIKEKYVSLISLLLDK